MWPPSSAASRLWFTNLSEGQLQSSVNAHVDAVFVLSVRSFADRIAHIQRELEKHEIAFEWIFEHDASELSPELIEATFAPSDLGRPQQSLVLKHIETWKRCVERGYRRVLVFEDDSILASDFRQRFAGAMVAAEGIAEPFMIYLGCGDNKYVEPISGAPSPLVRTSIPLPATDATVLSARAAQLRLEYVAQNRITRPADWLMREADAAMGVAHFWLSQPIVEQGSINGRFASVLDRKRIGRGRAWSWIRFRWDRWRRLTVKRALHDVPAEDSPQTASQIKRNGWALAIARGAAALVAIGSFTGPALANVGAAVMVLAFLAAPTCLQRVKRTLIEPLGWATILLLGIFLLATTWSSVPFPAALSAWTGWRSFILLFVALAIFDTRAAKLRFAALFVAATGAATIASFFAFDFGAAHAITDVKGGIVMRNHVTQAMALTVGAALALVLIISERRGSWKRWLWGAAATIMVANIVFVAYARSGYLALIVMAVVASLGLWRGRARAVALLGAFVLIVTAIQFSPLIKQRFATAVEEVGKSDDSAVITPMGIRVTMWETSAAIVRQAPFFGHGLGSFPDSYRRLVRERHSGWKATLTADPHNQYLLILAETGLLGLAAFAWFLYGAARQPARGPFRVIGLGLLLVWCLTSLFSSHFHAFNEAHLISIMLGVCLAREIGARTQTLNAVATAERTAS